MDILKDVFDFSFNKEKQPITIGDKTVEAFFRRSETDCIMYVPFADKLTLGGVFVLNGDKYLITDELRSENTTYCKYHCDKMNDSFKRIYAKGDIRSYDCLVKPLQYRLNVSNNGVSIGSNIEVLLSLDDNSRLLNVNKTFYLHNQYFANKDGSYYYSHKWKIRDVQHKDGVVHLFCEWTSSLPTDDTVNGIADRWSYEQNPNADPLTYSVTFSPKTFSLHVGDTQTIIPTVKITAEDGTDVTSKTPYTLHIAPTNASICSVDNLTIKALKSGSTALTASIEGLRTVDTLTADTINVSVEANVYTFTLSDSSIELQQGATKTVTATVTKNGISVASPVVTWSSDDETIATVNDKGLISALKQGSTVIRANYTDDDGEAHTAQITLTVSMKNVYTIALDPTSVILHKDDTKALNAVVKKNGEVVSSPTIGWASSDGTIASVQNGTITALKTGNATITASFTDEYNEVHTATTTVSVHAVYALKLNASTAKVSVGKTETITATVTKDGEAISSPQIEWSTSDSTKATVTSGVISGVAEGNATITASFTDEYGNKLSQSVAVTVEMASKYTKKINIGYYDSNLTYDPDDASRIYLYKNTFFRINVYVTSLETGGVLQDTVLWNVTCTPSEAKPSDLNRHSYGLAFTNTNNTDEKAILRIEFYLRNSDDAEHVIKEYKLSNNTIIDDDV